MLKRTFIRTIVLGSVVFACFFILVSADRSSETLSRDGIETGAQNDKTQSKGEFILESFMGSAVIGTH
jgi:hypothetical protein